jgi:hypothetical protein
MLHSAISFTVILFFAPVFAQGEAPAQVDPEYVRITTERAQKIVAKLGIEDQAKADRARDIIARQYRDLSAIHAKRDAALATVNQQASGDKAIADAAKARVQLESDIEQFRLHYAFLARLATELTPSQVDQVKDGLTFNVVTITFQRYQELLPTLTDEQKRHIHALLLEAREHAMDASSSEAKHAMFGKYKGRINNYLSAAGFDLKAAERALQERERALKAAG